MLFIEKCLSCKELPFCIGTCGYAIIDGKAQCHKKEVMGMSIKERFLLDYYSDQTKEEKDYECR